MKANRRGKKGFKAMQRSTFRPLYHMPSSHGRLWGVNTWPMLSFLQTVFLQTRFYYGNHSSFKTCNCPILYGNGAPPARPYTAQAHRYTTT
ncbi:MAG: hypothetical protein EAY75_00240 [Bacteroidetes bacterium]|nr:MAG: hypothetical protein EAY75_00240 [Bacteroidota bacterium]